MRIARTSGLSRRQIADDLGAGVSTLNPWVNAHRDTDVASAEDCELARRITAWARDPHPQGFKPDPRNSLGACFPGEREILKSHPVRREPKAMRFRFVEEQRGAFPIDRLCQVTNVSPRGLRAFRSRPASRWGSVLNFVYLARSMRFQILKRRSARRTLWRTGCEPQTIPGRFGRLSRSCGWPGRSASLRHRLSGMTRGS